jgi:hypothetical protein
MRSFYVISVYLQVQDMKAPFSMHVLGVFAPNTNADLLDELKTLDARRERYMLNVSDFDQKRQRTLFLWGYAVKDLVENVFSLEKRGPVEDCIEKRKSASRTFTKATQLAVLDMTYIQSKHPSTWDPKLCLKNPILSGTTGLIICSDTSNTAPTTRIGPPSTEERTRWRSLGQLTRVLFQTTCVSKSSTFRTYFYENSAMLDYACGGKSTQNGSTLKRVSRPTQTNLRATLQAHFKDTLIACTALSPDLHS